MIALLAAALLAQERVDLNPPMETWYKVVQGTHQVGYFHETFKRAATRWRYEYGLEGEFELTLRGKPHAEDLLVSAFLDDAFSPVEYGAEGHANEEGWSILSFVHGDERRVEVGTTAWVLPGRDDAHFLPSLTLVALRQNETLSKPGQVTLRAIGKDKHGIDVVLEVAESTKREYLKKDVSVIPISFLKPFPATRRETEVRTAYVDRFGRILEAVTANGTRIVVAATRAEAMEGIGLLHRHGRRDPMDKATAMRNAALERAREARGDVDLPVPWVTLDSLDSDLAAAKKMIEEVRSHKAAGDLDEARKTYLKALVHLKAIRELAGKRRPSMLASIEEARDEAELAFDGAAQVKREAGALFVATKELADRLDVEGLEKTQKELLALRNRLEVERRPERDDIAVWASDVSTIVVKVRTRRELARARIDVSGITVGDQATREAVDFRVTVGGRDVGSVEEVTFVRPFAMADINGRLYRQGDVLAGTQIRIEKISRHSVQVALRDEIREVPLRR
jgi:hypothetical protein